MGYTVPATRSCCCTGHPPVLRLLHGTAGLAQLTEVVQRLLEIADEPCEPSRNVRCCDSRRSPAALSRLRQVAVDPEARLAHVGPGCLLGTSSCSQWSGGRSTPMASRSAIAPTTPRRSTPLGASGPARSASRVGRASGRSTTTPTTSPESGCETTGTAAGSPPPGRTCAHPTGAIRGAGLAAQHAAAWPARPRRGHRFRARVTELGTPKRRMRASRCSNATSRRWRVACTIVPRPVGSSPLIT
jgi:hypothetical protein